jgi:hypothetical protein
MSEPDGAHRHRVRTPTHELSRPQRLERQRRHVQLLSGALLLVLAMLAYSAAFDLDHPAEWIVLGGIVFTAAGAMIAVYRP